MFINNIQSPYIAVIFTSELKEGIDFNEYGIINEEMMALAATIEGFLGVDSAREELGITVSYWKDMDAVNEWKHHTRHLFAKKKGREEWYKCYSLRICRVESSHVFE